MGEPWGRNRLEVGVGHMGEERGERRRPPRRVAPLLGPEKIKHFLLKVTWKQDFLGPVKRLLSPSFC